MLTEPQEPQIEKPAKPIWNDETLENPHSVQDKKARVEAMFDAIAPTYERVNSLATFGRDAAWRRKAIAAVRPQPREIALDVCCGTGDMLRTLAQIQPKLRKVIGVDFSAGMLAGGAYADSSEAIVLLRGDGQRLPLRDAAVDLVTCAFGVRNFQNLKTGICEMARVCKPGGHLAILEFANPTNPVLRAAFQAYCEIVLPRIGVLVSRDPTGAYRYLPKSISSFETRASMEAIIRDAGFANVASKGMNLGGVVLYTGTRGGA